MKGWVNLEAIFLVHILAGRGQHQLVDAPSGLKFSTLPGGVYIVKAISIIPGPVVNMY